MSTEERILKAATKLFYERGFHAVGVAQIGATAGMTGPGLYRHFDSKEQILAALFDRALDSYMVALPRVSEDPFAELVELVRMHVAQSAKHHELALIWAREDHSLSEGFRRRLHRREDAYLASWLDCLERCFPERPKEELALSARAALTVMNMLSGPTGRGLDEHRHRDLVVELVLGLFGALDKTVDSRLTAAADV